MPVKKILVPIDASDVSLSHLSLKALSWAGSFAREFCSTVYLMAVVENIQSMYDVYEDEHVLVERKSKAFAHVNEILDEAEKQAKDMAIPCIVRVAEPGVPNQKIIEFAECEKIDLIVMGTHGRTGIKRLLAGSVTEDVIRHAPCPVLVCPTSHPYHTYNHTHK